jgi:hypothetical protein
MVCELEDHSVPDINPAKAILMGYSFISFSIFIPQLVPKRPQAIVRTLVLIHSNIYEISWTTVPPTTALPSMNPEICVERKTTT